MKNKKEQAFCTKLGAWLKTTKHPQSMLIECKISETDYFLLSQLRPAQRGTFNRMKEGLPIVHKISDSSVGSKLVDIIYISPKNKFMQSTVAVYFTNSKQAYLIPYEAIDAHLGRIPESLLAGWRVW